MINCIRRNSFRDVVKEAENLRLSHRNTVSDKIVNDLFFNAEQITQKVVFRDSTVVNWTEKADNILTSKLLGYPIMLMLLSIVFWLTISGANLPCEVLGTVLFGFQDVLTACCNAINAPEWFHGFFVLGLYRGLAWVVSVMLPPMAIFFPLFTLLEDLGYLPRVAFNLDHIFKKARACGKQSLTMCMGFGCNAAGVVSCRIIDSPRERLIAMLTNTFVPCNGRFPTLIAIGTIFGAGALAQGYQTFAVAGIITFMVLIGVSVTFGVSWLLSRTILKGEGSSMVLELPPYRRPKIGAVIYRSMLDRTLFVLKRAAFIAAPAGGITWVLGNTYIGDTSVIGYLAELLQPFAYQFGLDGYILMAFILGIPANEIVLPILIMSYISSGMMVELDSLTDLGLLLVDNGWTWLTAINVMFFTLLHWPCATTLLTTLKETGCKKWTFMAFIIPTSIAFLVCFVMTQIFRFSGLI